MNTKQSRLLMLFFVTTLFACNSNDFLENSIPSPVEEVSIVVTQAPHDGSNTRATDAGFQVGDAIGIFAVKHQEGTLKSSGNIAHNKKWIYAENDNGVKEWTPATEEDKIYYLSSDEKLDFYAYYPYSDTNTDPINMQLAVKADQSAGITSSDLMAAKNTRGLWRGPVTFQFAHQLSRMELTVVRLIGTGTTDHSLTAALNANTLSYNFNLQTMVVTTGTPAGTPQPMTFRPVSSNDGDNITTDVRYLYHLILPPQNIAPARDCFLLKLDGRDYRSKTESVLTLTAGKRTAHEIVLNFNPIVPAPID